MSTNIPFEIQIEIIKRVVSLKSLLRFRSVSKQWKSLIDSSEFITHHHSVSGTHQRHLLVRYEEDSEYKYVSIVDDDSFPEHKFSIDVSPPKKLVTDAKVLECSYGLVCLFGVSASIGKNLIVVWNPSIRKSVGIVPSGRFTVLGIGVCPKTCDLKIVTTSPTKNTDLKWKAEVFKLSSGCWKSILMNIQMPENNYTFGYHQVVIDGIIYWVYLDSVSGYLLSFDLTSEEFGKVDLPHSFSNEIMSIFKFKESLVVLDCDEWNMVHDVWMMIKNGDSNFSFEKLYSISYLAYDGCEFDRILGFTKNGQAIWEHECTHENPAKLEAYEPSTRRSRDLGIDVYPESEYEMISYTESLLLLNYSDFTIYDDGHISS